MKIIFAVFLFITLGLINMSEAGQAGKNSGDTGKFKTATFAGGCFWCMQPPFDRLQGVISTTAGYTGGTKQNPSYAEVSSGRTGHAEAIEIVYDPSLIDYAKLLDVFWRNIDPTALNRQFVDAGSQYRTAIFYHDEEQKKMAEASRERLQGSGRYEKPIVTEILPAAKFYRAEDYHQEYYKNYPNRYHLYKYGSGRPQYLKKKWGTK